MFDLLFELDLGKRRFVGIDSDIGHVGNHVVLFDYTPDGIPEILNLFLFCHGDEVTHARLTLQQRLVRLLH